MSEHKLYNGDCLEIMDKLIEEGVMVDAIICDPPYGTTACKWDSVIPFDAMWSRLNKLIKPNGAIVLFGSQPFTTDLINSNRKNFKYTLVWDKQRSCGSMLAKKRPLKYHEDIIVFYKKQPVYNPQMREGKTQSKASGGYSDNYGNINTIRYKNNLYYPRSILDFKACHNMQGKVHPTQKPVDLLEYLIKTYTNENETVLDFTMGSGSTGVACMNTNRRFIGIELDENYFNIAKDRIENSVKNK